MVREMIKVNGWSSVFVILILLISLSECEILTKQENENRLSVCGTKNAAKVWQGRTAAQTEAPWSVFMVRFVGHSSQVCTATIVSSRHILMATHCFADPTPNGYLEDPTFDKTKNCRNGHYVMEDAKFLEKIKFESDGKAIARSPERVVFVNACVRKTVSPSVSWKYVFDDFAIVDLYEDLVFSPTVQPVCVPHDASAYADGVQLDYFGFGINPPDETPGVLRHEKTAIKHLLNFWFVAKDPHKKNIACEGDSGGGAVGHVNGRITLFGALSQTSCNNADSRTDNATELYAAVGYYYPVICQYTGICSSSDHDTHHNGYARAPKPIRTTRPPPTPKIVYMGPAPGYEQENGAHSEEVHHFVTLALSLVLSLIV